MMTKNIWMKRGVHALVVVVALAIWFWTQSLIGQKKFPESGIGDGIFDLTAPAHAYLLDHPAAANALLIGSSAVIDLLGVFILASSIFGPSIRPLVGLMMLFALRQICQALCSLPPPDGMIWHNPGFPTLLVTYGVSNDLFFSGHTALAVFGAIELCRFRNRALIVLAVFVAFFEVGTVLVLRAHYTMDVFTGALAAMFIGIVSYRIAPACDRFLDRLIDRG